MPKKKGPDKQDPHNFYAKFSDTYNSLDLLFDANDTSYYQRKEDCAE